MSARPCKHGAGSCPIGRVPAGELEAAVIDQLRAVFRRPEIVAGTWKAARVQDGDPVEEREHWVGCARGCGSPAESHLSVQATPDGGYERRRR